MSDRRWPCACCGYLTLTEEPSGTYDICPVCFWEQDNVQEGDPSYWGGANRVSLNDARENFKRFGAVEERLVVSVREPTLDEKPD